MQEMEIKPGNSLLTIVIPAFNESKSLPVVLPKVLDHCKKMNWKIILINDGSTDTTSSVLADFVETNDFKIFHHKLNRGYGGAIKTGIRNTKTKYCVTIDADGQHDLNDIEKLLECITNKNADLVIGNRVYGLDSGKFRELGKGIIKRVAKLMMQLDIHDLNSGMKIFNTRLAQNYISLCPNSMAYSDIITLIFIYERNLVLEIPINIHRRIAGKSTIGMMTAFDTILEILNIVTLFNPMRIFLPVSLFFLIISIIWEIPIFVVGNGVSTGAVLGFITSILFFLLGLIAEQLGSIRRLKIEEISVNN